MQLERGFRTGVKSLPSRISTMGIILTANPYINCHQVPIKRVLITVLADSIAISKADYSLRVVNFTEHLLPLYSSK